MLVNLSSTIDSSFPPNLSTMNHSFTSETPCIVFSPNSFFFASVTINSIILLLPLSITVLYLGSTSSAAAMTHSDCFTYNMAAVELFGIAGSIFCSGGIYSYQSDVLMIGRCLFSITTVGEIFIHVLACVERYLAVIHPITYLALKKERGIRLRNMTIGCVWLLSCVLAGLMMMEDHFMVLNFFIVIPSALITSFCSISVLLVLIRPGPGGQVRGGQRVDQSKRRAFYTIVAILGVLVMRFVFGVIWAVMFILGEDLDCLVMACGICFQLPCSLVLPLMFLHREGKLRICPNTPPNPTF